MTENLHKHRSRWRPDRLRSLLRRYAFEIIWLAVVALGIFLIFERMNIRSGLFRWAGRIARGGLRGVGQLGTTLSEWLSRTTLSDAIGIVLVGGALVAIVLRLRWRLLNNRALSTQICPKCQGTVHRVHRTWYDRLISAFVPVRRFRCASSACRWKGLRIHSTRGSGRIQSTPATSKSA